MAWWRSGSDMVAANCAVWAYQIRMRGFQTKYGFETISCGRQLSELKRSQRRDDTGRNSSIMPAGGVCNKIDAAHAKDHHVGKIMAGKVCASARAVPTPLRRFQEMPFLDRWQVRQ